MLHCLCVTLSSSIYIRDEHVMWHVNATESAMSDRLH